MLRCDAFQEEGTFFFWIERQAIPSHQMLPGLYPPYLERSTLTNEPVSNFSSKIIETHQRLIPRVTRSVVQPHTPVSLLYWSTRWDYLKCLSSQGRNWFTCSLNTAKDLNALQFFFFFFRYLASFFLTLTTWEICDQLCVKSMFRMC